jgi:hypothetical protein
MVGRTVEMPHIDVQARMMVPEEASREKALFF